jgi:hypothetical protein
MRSGYLALRVTVPQHRFCDDSGLDGYYIIKKMKVNFTLEQATKAQRERRIIALLVI